MPMSDEFDVGVPNHTVTARLGRGGMASVYLAHDHSLNRKVAIKIMDGTLEADPDFIRRFEREAQVAAGLVHPNIVSVHHYGQTDSGRWFLTMDYVDGGSLADLLKNGPLDMERALAVTRDIASALAAAHARQIIHRDIKPDNIMFQGESACLTDFGIAKLLDATTQLTTAGSPGTVRYMAPEQVDGNIVDGRTDIYALGVVLYEMLTGELPVDAPSLSSMLYRIAHEPPAPLPSDLAGLQPLLDAMLAKNPADRIEDCRTLADIVRSIERNVIRGLPQDQWCADTPLAAPVTLRTPAQTPPVRLPSSSHPSGHIGDTQIAPAVDAAAIGRAPHADIRAPTSVGVRRTTATHTLPQARPARRRPVLVALLATLALLVAGAGVYLGVINPQAGASGTGRAPASASIPAPPAAIAAAPVQAAPRDTNSPGAPESDPAEPPNSTPQGLAAPPPGVVTITTVPAAARLSIDGGEAIPAPLAGEPMPAGQYRVRATAAGHEPLETVVDVRSSDVLRRQLTLRPLPGSIRIDSTPRGAWIEIDGQRIAATTPHDATRLIPGDHTLRIGADGFEPQTRSIAIRPGATAQLDLRLGREPTGVLTVRTDPADARVTVLDAPQGYTPGMVLRPGRWQVEVSREGYSTRTLSVDLQARESVIDVRLQSLPVIPEMRLQPPDARVEIERDGLRSLWQPGTAVAAGPAIVHVSAPGFGTESRPVELGPGNTRFDFALQAEHMPGSSFRDPLADGGSGPWMTVVPAGRFVMGDATDNPSRRARPLREVRVERPLAVGRYEVTWDEYALFALATGRALPDDRGWGRGNRPVIMVTWEDARAYTQWLSTQTGARYRLLSEAQWEYAARSGSSSRFAFGDDARELCRYANVRTFEIPDWPAPVDCEDGHVDTAPVGSYEANAFGLHDMHGNVSEWVSDCWQTTLADLPEDASPRQTGNCERRTIRGGSFYHAAASVASAFRYGVPADAADAVIGFRVAREL